MFSLNETPNENENLDPVGSQDLFRSQSEGGLHPVEQHQTQPHVFITYFLDYDLDFEVAIDTLNHMIL